MFRHIEGCKAQHGDMTLMIAHNFVEWHVMIVKNSNLGVREGRAVMFSARKNNKTSSTPEHQTPKSDEPTARFVCASKKAIGPRGGHLSRERSFLPELP